MNTRINVQGNKLGFSSYDPATKPIKINWPAKKRKSKKKNHQQIKMRRRDWWHNLSEDEKGSYIEHKQQDKAIKREDKTRAAMVKYGQKYQCSECFHRKGGSCVDNLPNGCQYWYNPDSSYQGISYER